MAGYIQQFYWPQNSVLYDHSEVAFASSGKLDESVSEEVQIYYG